MISRQGNIIDTTLTETPQAKLDFPKWDKMVAFSVYRSWLENFIVNALLLMAVKNTTDLGCAKYLRSLFKLLMIKLPSNTIYNFSDNVACAKKGIEM